MLFCFHIFGCSSQTKKFQNHQISHSYGKGRYFSCWFAYLKQQAPSDFTDVRFKCSSAIMMLSYQWQHNNSDKQRHTAIKKMLFFKRYMHFDMTAVTLWFTWNQTLFTIWYDYTTYGQHSYSVYFHAKIRLTGNDAVCDSMLLFVILSYW